MHYSFRSVRSVPPRTERSPFANPSGASGISVATEVSQQVGGESINAAQKVIGNLLGHVPTEAVALSTSLAPLAAAASERRVAAWFVCIGSLGLMILVRWLNHADRSIWITSGIAFLLWMALIPHGAFQVTWPWLVGNAMLVLILAGIFSAAVTVLASAGILK